MQVTNLFRKITFNNPTIKIVPHTLTVYGKNALPGDPTPIAYLGIHASERCGEDQNHSDRAMSPTIVLCPNRSPELRWYSAIEPSIHPTC